MDPDNPPLEEKTEQQKEEERKRLQQEARLKQEEQRVKREEEIKKLNEALKTGLSGFSKTADYQTMCYNRLSIAEKEIERLYDTILNYKHIRFLDINTNAIVDISLVAGFPALVWINASKNNIQSLQVFSKPNVLTQVQFVNLSTNKIAKLEQLALPALRRLNLNQNEIVNAEGWNNHDTLEILEMRKNKLKKLKNIKNMPKLTELYLCQNQISDLRGLENLPSLKRLYLRNNKIKKIMKPFPHLQSLYHLNLRQNLIQSLDQIGKIENHVRSLTFLANPICDSLADSAKKEVIWRYPHLERVNKGIISIEERVEFEKEWKDKLAERQRERLEKLAQEEEASKNQKQPEA